MADEIEIRDTQAGIEMAWHNKTKVVKTVTLKDAFPFELVRTPLFIGTLAEMPVPAAPVKKAVKTAEVATDGKATAKKSAAKAKVVTPKMHLVKPMQIPGWSVFICDDDKEIAGVPVRDSYDTLTNARFWEIVNNSLGGTDAVVESAGTLKDRTRRFITIRMGMNPDFTVGNRVFKNRISFLDSVDGSTNFYGINSSTCVVCANTFRMVRGDKSGEFRFKLRHTRGLITAIEGMETTINELCGVGGEFKAAMEAAAEMPVNEEETKHLFAGWLADGETEISTRFANTATRLTELSRVGRGNSGTTLLDVFSGATDFYSHESSGGEDKPGFRWKQAESSEIGAGAKAKESFYRSIFQWDKADNFAGVNRAGIADLQKLGKTVLAKQLAVAN